MDAQAPHSHGWRTAIGTLQFLAAQAVALALGFAVSIILTRTLGPDRYGLYAVAIAVVMWIEQSITSVFYQPTVKFLAEAASWEPVAATLIRAQLAVSIAAGALLAVLAAPLATWLVAPGLTPYLRLLALSVPITALARGHQCTLVGRGAFGRSTLPSFLYWMARLTLVAVLLQMGLSIWAGIWAWILAAAVELFAFRLLVHPPLWQRSSFPLRTLLSYSAPLFLNSMVLRLLTYVDLLLVQARAGTGAAGWYSAAQNLTLIPLGFLGAALASPLLSTLSHLKGQQDQAARSLVTQALRFLLCLAPFAALVAGAASQIVNLMYGPTYLPASPMLAWLICGALALTLLSVCGALLTAAGRPGWTLPLTAPLLPAATLAHWILIPRHGAVAAAAVTSAAAVLGALGCLAAVAHIWQVRLPLRTIARSAAIAAGAYALARAWPLTGLALIVKLGLLAVLVVLAFVALGELSGQELQQLRALARWQLARAARPRPHSQSPDKR